MSFRTVEESVHVVFDVIRPRCPGDRGRSEAGSSPGSDSQAALAGARLPGGPDIVVACGRPPGVRPTTGPATGLASGSNLTVQWNDVDTGDLPVTGSFDDHVNITNTSTGEVLDSADIPYAPTVSGPISPSLTSPLSQGLAGYWPLDGNGNDLSGNGHDLALYGGVGECPG